MTPSFPYIAYPGTGQPLTFWVGTSTTSYTRFDVHHLLLAQLSPLFAHPSSTAPRLHSGNMLVVDVEPTTFRTLFTWLYERTPPDYTVAADLLPLMKLWVLAGKLGIWKTQNTVLRLGMALMQPRHFVCGVETVKWVYENTAHKSPLRRYIITIFCQRAPPVTPALFRESEGLRKGILGDASGFLRKLEFVRKGNPKGVGGYHLRAEFPLEHVWIPARDSTEMGQCRGCLVTGGKQVEWSKVEYPLPSFLVWGAGWEVLPDMHFVGEKDVWETGGLIAGQIQYLEKNEMHRAK